MRKFIFTACALIVVACSASVPEPILTDEKFDTRTLDDGSTEFVYGISWRDTSPQSLSSNHDTPPPAARHAAAFRGAEQGSRFAILADNQTKLELEDKAAEGLQKKLHQQALCPDGHQITDVIWRDDNIRLVGKCH